MKLAEKRRLAKKTPTQLTRIRKRKAKATAKREAREAEMAQYLLDNGWVRCGVLNDVWKHDNWTPYQENPQTQFGYVKEESGLIRKVWSTEPSRKPWKSGETFMTLHQAYRNQQKLESIGYEAPKTIDDDLADLL